MFGSTNTRYIDKGVQYERQFFPEDYFTGCDVSVYFGDVWVDEVTSLQFSLTEAVKPIYGYASRTADAFARGSRVVAGRFSIAFREAGYLNTILGHIGQLSSQGAKPALAYELANQPVPQWFADARETIEQLLTRYGDEVGTIERINNYEREIWGRDFTTNKDHKNRTFFYSDRTNAKHQESLKKKGFDIYITYGNVVDKVQRGANVATTVKAVRGVQITGVHQAFDPSGNPIQEIYEFVAKDLD